MTPFTRTRDGLVARLDRAEVDVLGLLCDQLEQLLDADAEDAGGDPVLARLLPPGHRGDPEVAADYRSLTEGALREGKADDLAVVRATLPVGGGDLQLDTDQARAWLRSTNDLRLALGTRLDITEDTEPPAEVTSDEEQQLAVYYWLTAVQGSLVDAVTAAGRGRR
ncbi:DUF2017 family protein [Modestobacter sp. I12A-02628]|uniref:DUF2017 family protein n=1 Tax=Goekera deserti TaxID=2497753 RepID=A0A7K3WBR0_9ACTN|nr:DUF2017 domain-containing protein [Goekera deserti]MPQ98322.1 DUF2017 family protein [Goekera deserti]NDI48149.1 DUF2017 family protein [Goekera deserti]NEL53898.1 DUF2017 family protein [Goekera deserti]